MIDRRPKWEFTTPNYVAKWLAENSVKIIEIYHRHDGSLTTEHFLIFSTYTFDHKESQLPENRLQVSPLIFQYGGVRPEVIFTPQYDVRLVELDTRLINKLRNICDWDSNNKKDIDEYNRLKKKFNND